MTATTPPQSKRAIWLTAMRPRTLPLALASIGMGIFLAAADGQARWFVALLCALTTVFLQVLSNLANDYGDSIHGADSSQRTGPKRVTQQGLITRTEMRQAMIIFAILSMTSGTLLVILAFGLQQLPLFLGFIALGAAAIWAAIAYTATANPYGYVGLGDLFVLIFFGWVGTLGTYFVQAQSIQWDLLLPASSVGLLAVAVLNVNNIRDIKSDRDAGKRSIPVRIGLAAARRYHWALLTAAVLTAAAYTLIDYRGIWQWLFVLALPLVWRTGYGVATQPQTALDPFLKQTALTTLLFVATFGIGLLLATWL